ncbi:MAG: TetR/AcrR family transcriptional regulator [Pseudomonadales bacterium]|jgi:AcrR family transcriptional regulator|nr:TetR/AcrR family transcriptional regulator [Pseudomonadales bacterium]MDP7595487.1 TetR/AcrR family transcriptional regulator [Pseudomonadales bacterium]HJN52439.1 TetR/AcrR family transcriptional regulator [Pseudomonadales bacterium]|tara:strand:+ start:531 stop:1181 length:651 start_codon:yes stop_codon:yes gene_type:complete
MADPSSRRERKKQETRYRILAVAGELLASQGFESTTLDQIAESADVSKATFYNYFPNKDALLQQIAEIEMADIGELLAVESGHLAGPLAMLKRTMELLYSDSSPVMIVVRHLLLDAVKHDGEIPAAVLAMRNHSDFLDLVQRAQDDGDLRSDLDAVVITQRLSSAYLAASIFCKSVGKGELALSDVATKLMESAGIVGEQTFGSSDDPHRPAVVTT